MDCFQGVIEQSHRKRDDKMSRARQGGLRPNRRHVQRGSDMISFVLDVAGKTQSSLPIPLHLSFRTDGEDALFAAMVSGATSMRTMPNTARHRRTSLRDRNVPSPLVAQSDSERWSTEPEVAGSNPAGGTCCSLLLQCANRFLSHEGGENSINFPRKPCSGFSLLYPAAWVGISHAGQPWWGAVGQVSVAQMVEAWS